MNVFVNDATSPTLEVKIRQIQEAQKAITPRTATSA